MRNERGRPPVYHCLSSPKGSHYMTIDAKLASELKCKLKDIHISLRAAYREGSANPRMSIARLMAGSPLRPYQFTLAAVARWERPYGPPGREQRLVLSDVYMPPLPWTISSPIVLLFKEHALFGSESWLTLTLGRCTVQSSTIRLSEDSCDTSNPSSESRPFGKHYAVAICAIVSNETLSQVPECFAPAPVVPVKMITYTLQLSPKIPPGPNFG